MNWGNGLLRTANGFPLPDQNNPYTIIVLDANGKPVCTPEHPYLYTDMSVDLRGKAYEKFWKSYPAMNTLLQHLPSELRCGFFQGRGCKDGYLLYYGFRVEPDQMEKCAAELQLDYHGPIDMLHAIRNEVYKRSEERLFPWAQISTELPVPARSERFGCGHIITLYSNGEEGIGKDGQSEPKWFWDYSHGPNFETLQNKDAWDVADVLILEDDEE
ncbi:uncharacterized protein TRAVEDRAFT_54205 [Trametes versicolor FP-101664 SS1]|uniref:Uncharacterized protein n=1 Tax=Trametes versicolor (strain FP-101664) TaxID=717944 RepID=R7S7W1_TRAVS|nr:uncharacterized protein TRAVEDRAFT_54205 [Trametes versicolor FP-101664 SS1]EIW51780.1 hypothetical protein TRAVEDRAFT_54205 [Trametes versicolor FP-101664 SS1]